MYTSSVDIRPDWRVLEQVNFSALTKLSLSVDEPEDLAFCGSLWHYDKSYDRLTAKNTKRLEKTQRVFSGPASSEDPMLMYGCVLFASVVDRHCHWRRMHACCDSLVFISWATHTFTYIWPCIWFDRLYVGLTAFTLVGVHHTGRWRSRAQRRSLPQTRC